MEEVDQPSDADPTGSADKTEKERLELERLALVSRIVGTVLLVVSLVHVGLEFR